MKRSELKRTPFKPKESTGLLRVEAMRRTRMKVKRPKSTPIRKSARGMPCTICLEGVCNFDAETTVLCHSNSLADGKGMGLKAPDTAAAYGCSACHDVLDGRRPIPEWLTRQGVDAAFRRGIERTHGHLRAVALL